MRSDKNIVIPTTDIHDAARIILARLLEEGCVTVNLDSETGQVYSNAIRHLRNDNWPIKEGYTDFNMVEYRIIFSDIPSNILKTAKYLILNRGGA